MEEKTVQVKDGKLFYLFEGKGPALILLHSLGVSSEAWGKVIEPLAQRYTVYAPDMLGHGDSDEPPGNYLVEDYARSDIAFMDKLGLERAILCGNSVGALIALEMAATYPQRVEKLILVGCPARDIWGRMERLTLASLTYDIDGKPKPLSLADLYMHYVSPTPELVEWVNKQQAKAGLSMKKAMIAVTLYDVPPKLPLVKCPTLVLSGSQDVVREQENVVLEGIKGAKHALVPDAGHLPQVEQPQAFVREVIQFLG